MEQENTRVREFEASLNRANIRELLRRSWFDRLLNDYDCRNARADVLDPGRACTDMGSVERHPHQVLSFLRCEPPALETLGPEFDDLESSFWGKVQPPRELMSGERRR